MKSSWLVFVFVALGWFAVRYFDAQQQRIAVDALRNIDAQVIYESQATNPNGLYYAQQRPPGPNWLHPILGVDFFDSVKIVSGDLEFADEHVKYLAPMRNLKQFGAYQSLLTDDGIANICKIRSIQSLNVSGTALTDEGCAHFQNLRELEILKLWRTSITDDAVPHLAKLTNLKALYLGDSLISAEAIDELKSALPNCEIKWSVRKEPPPRPKPIDAKYVDLLHALMDEIMTCESLEYAIKFYGPEKIDHIVLDSTSVPWPENFKSKSKDITYRQMKTQRELELHDKKLRKSSGESLCMRIDKFDLNIKPTFFDGPIVVVIYNKGGNTIGGCRATFVVDKKDGKWIVEFQSYHD